MDGVSAMPQKHMDYWKDREKNKTHAWAITNALMVKAKGEIDRAAQGTKLYWEYREVPDMRPEEGRQGQAEVSVVQSPRWIRRSRKRRRARTPISAS